MILHYLGLDHVGHSQGPHSDLMAPKQLEMDGIVEKIYKKIFPEDTNPHDFLFVLCSDHGMNEIGNHGGASAGETSSILLFIDPRFEVTPSADNRFGRVSQIDFAPTLSLLFGLPIPSNSLGSAIGQVLPKETRLRLLRRNACHLVTLAQESTNFMLEESQRKRFRDLQQDHFDLIQKTKNRVDPSTEALSERYARFAQDVSDALTAQV
eukprot:TRINITY_DN4986_c0_g1_i3.p2 TRINITY_DN4986_c0_g1~~TRINITY_DN4986_c0_g1_i3.p2  ORF type:complete len:209 (-),score=25.13 TRINITY_DN4986_c0_g1_i3:1305-1931(-)